MTQHEHEHEVEETFGIAIGFRIIEEGGELFLAEAEIAPYIDQPEELGVTVVFHPLEGIDPATMADDDDGAAWPIDVDDDLHVDGGSPLAEQFAAIVRQLRAVPEDRLIEYLVQARSDAENAN